MTKRLKKFIAITVLMTSVMMVAAPSPAYALTADELAEAIADLQEQLAALTAQLDEVDGEEEAVAVEGCDISSFDRNLEVGDTGDDVKCLQIVLNSDSDTEVADSGVGSPGEETSYFGPLTKAAVIKFQELYADDVLASWGLTAGTGFVGSTSRAKLNELLVVAEEEEEEEGVCSEITDAVECVTAGCSWNATTDVCSGVVADEDEDEEDVVGELSVSSLGPVASTFVGGQATGTLLDIKFSGTGTVVGITLQRIGVSANTTPSNIYLFDGATRLTDAGTLNSESLASFNDPNGLFVVDGTKTISVKSDIASVSGETVGMKLTVVTLASGTVSGLPVTGNLHSIASATLAGVALGAISPSTSSVNAANDVVVWKSTATISTRVVTLERLALRNIGSIVSSDIENFRLLISGTQVAQVQNLDANGYATFDLTDSPLSMSTGSRIFQVKADIIGGAGRNVQMSLRRAADIGLVDSSFNVNLTASDTYPAGTGVISINSGTITVTKTSDSPSGNITRGATDIVMAKYTFTARGEAVKVETLTVTVDTSGTDANITMRNVRVMVNGAQVGSTTSVPAVEGAATGTSFTTNFVVYTGIPAAVEIRMDIFDNEGTDDFASTTPTIDVSFVTGVSNGVPQVSLGTIHVPTSSKAGNQLTVAAGSITLTQVSTYAAQTVVVPQTTAYKLGAFNLTGNSTEAVDVSEFEIDFTTDSTFDGSDDLTDVYIQYGNSTSTVTGTVADADNTWSVTFQLAVNETMVIEVYAIIGATITDGDTMIVNLTVTGTTSDSAATVYADLTSSNTTKDAGFVGQTIAAGAGTFNVTIDASRPNAAIIDDSGTITSAIYKFATINDSYTITDVALTLANATTVANVMLMDGATVLATLPGATTVTFSGLSVPVVANSSKLLSINLEIGTVGTGAGTSSASVLTTLTSATALNSQGVSAGVSEPSTNPAGQAMYVYKAIPTIDLVTLPSGLLITGTRTIAKFTVSTNGTGTVAWKEILLEIAKTGGAADAGGTDPTLASFQLWNSDTSTQITAVETIQNANGDVATTCIETDTSCELLITVGTKLDDDAEETVSGATTYEVRATVGGTLATGDNISTFIDRNLNTFVASAIFTTNDNSTAANNNSFTWSDVSNTSHDTSTADWIQDFSVKNIPTATWTLTK